ncbi:MAG: hypothetical protein J3Q66DRAFT_391615, partial [Benniella sp.]
MIMSLDTPSFQTARLARHSKCRANVGVVVVVVMVLIEEAVVLTVEAGMAVVDDRRR